MIEITLYCIYNHPTDYPDKFVVRRWSIKLTAHSKDLQPRPDADPKLADTLEAARKFVPPGYHRSFESPFDDPVIAETWAKMTCDHEGV